MPEDTVSVCRPGKFGNPFKVGDGHPLHGRPMSHTEVVELFRAEMAIPFASNRLEFTETDLIGLRGKNLACYCQHGTPCHADVLLGLANG